jgi:hypothetical protein
MIQVFWTGFNRAKFNEEPGKVHCTLTADWNQKRFEHWKRFTWPSIQNQSVQEWRYFVCCDPATRDIVEPLFQQIDDPRLIVDFMGTPESEVRIEEFRKTWRQIVTMRIDSDDMYHPDAALAVKKYLQHHKQVDWVAFKQGYGVVIPNWKLFHYDTRTIGPFFAHRHRGTFGEGGIVNEPAHKSVKKRNPDILEPGMFMVMVHDTNTTTMARSICFREKMYGYKKQKVLNTFGVHWTYHP